MPMEFKLHVDEFVRDLIATREDIRQNTHNTMDQIKDNWVQEARDITPVKTRVLREEIHGTVEGIGMDSKILVTGNATNSSKGYRSFNYGYWLHEVAPSSTNLSTPGSVLKFLDQSARENEVKWMGWLEDDVRQAARRRGF
jgi:hypothetical protein